MPTGSAAIDSLHRAFGTLRSALDANDPAAILAASSEVRAITSDIRAQGAWRQDPALHEKIQSLLPMIDSARLRVNMASDHVRQRISLLADYGSDGAKLTYGR
ncbi:hypothetical protein [Sphingobium subterraneum]|uniref:Flagellar protein FliT n=1 Tax=Sphingobium subterraneum TaxID=627688 RepID=A0A841IYR4_9SPHN|nr:hypothetical protein [Sphingobium subterraneum]MBB6123803.1 hypothetical protein [Sphingobium subterraneum]